jgi:flagellar hook-length control protein FliK
VELGKQFVSIAQGTGSKPHTIELRLDPPDLGPLRISISLHDNTAQAAFVSPHAVVRQTVENALPQLQQALAQAGISLGQASVSDQGQPQQAFGQEAGNTGSNSNSGNGFSLDAASGVATAGPALAVSSRTLNPNTLVDTFA